MQLCVLEVQPAAQMLLETVADLTMATAMRLSAIALSNIQLKIQAHIPIGTNMPC